MTLNECITKIIDEKYVYIDPKEGKVYRLYDDKRKLMEKPKELIKIEQFGYKRAGFTFNRKTHNVYIHRLVWISENGFPEKGICVCHKNNIKTDNRISNLYLATTAQNIYDAKRDGLILRGEDNPNAKITEQDVINIRKEYIPHNVTSVFLAKKYNISASHLVDIANRRCWKHV